MNGLTRAVVRTLPALSGRKMSVYIVTLYLPLGVDTDNGEGRGLDANCGLMTWDVLAAESSKNLPWWSALSSL